MIQQNRLFAIIGLFLLSFCDDSKAIYLRTEIDEESEKGTVIVDMADLFSLRWEERAEREFELFDLQQLQLTHEVVDLEENFVEVNQYTGIITLTQRIDRDSICGQNTECTLKIQAIMKPAQFFKLLKLDVIIRDINDNSPLFPNNIIAINVSELVKRDDVVDLHAYQARDTDAGNNSKIEYTLSNNPYFKVKHFFDEAGSPQLKLILLKDLDYESKTSHQLQLTASDKGTPSLMNDVILHVIVLDENDNPPVFTPKNYVVTVKENKPPGSEILTVRADDLDTGANGHVTYGFVFDFPAVQSAIMRDLLSVDPTTGVVRLEQRLNYDNHNGLEFHIKASDHGEPPLSSRARITLNVRDVNDHSPVIKQNFIVQHDNEAAYLLESSPLNTYVAYVSVTDADYGSNGEVNVKIKTKRSRDDGADEDSGHFVLAPDGLIQTAQEFNCEVENQYYIIISACDKGDPSRCTESNITMEILDVNDNPPVFSSSVYEVTMAEDNDVGKKVIRVIASDDDATNSPVMMKNQRGEIVPSTNGQVEYSIQNNNVFSVDSQSGQVVLARPLDYEGNSKWEIIVVATDRGLPSRSDTCVVRVNVQDSNDNPPIFTSPPVDNETVYASILLDQPIITLQVVDYDSYLYSVITMNLIEIDGIRFDDVENSANTLFQAFLLDKTSGELSLNSSYEKLEGIIGEHYIVIQASDNGVPTLRSKTGLFVRVTKALELPQVFNDGGHRPSIAPEAFPSFFLIVIIAASALLFIIFVVATVMVWRCRRKKKQLGHSYSCRQAENECGPSPKSSSLTSKHDYIQNGNVIRKGDVISRHQSIETRTKSLSLSSNQTSVNKDALSPTSVVDPNSNPEIYQLLSNEAASDNSMIIVTSLPTSPAAQHRQCLLGKEVTCFGGRMTSSQADKDSGRGDSEVDATCWPGVGQERRTSSSYDATNQASNLGRFCTHDCTRYGHSDSCWMPESDGSPPGQPVRHSNSGVGLEPIRENPSLCLKPVVGLPCAPIAARDRLRKSLCLALMGTDAHHRQPFRSEPAYPNYPSEDLSRLRQLWTSAEEAKDDTPYSSVFGSASPSPAPSSVRCDSSSCDKDKPVVSPESEALLRREHYLSLVSNRDAVYSVDDRLRKSGCL